MLRERRASVLKIRNVKCAGVLGNTFVAKECGYTVQKALIAINRGYKIHQPIRGRYGVVEIRNFDHVTIKLSSLPFEA